MTSSLLQVQETMDEIIVPLHVARDFLRVEGPGILGAVVVFLVVLLLGLGLAAGVGRILAGSSWPSPGPSTWGISSRVTASGAWSGPSTSVRDTHIRTADGVDIFIPSAIIFRNPLLNFTRDGLRRGSFTVGIDYGDDAAAAVSLLEETVRGVDRVLADPPPVVEISGLTPNHVELKVHVWVDTFSGTMLYQGLTATMAACRKALHEAGFTFSSEVTTALDVPPLEVRRGRGVDEG